MDVLLPATDEEGAFLAAVVVGDAVDRNLLHIVTLKRPEMWVSLLQERNKTTEYRYTIGRFATGSSKLVC